MCLKNQNMFMSTRIFHDAAGGGCDANGAWEFNKLKVCGPRALNLAEVAVGVTNWCSTAWALSSRLFLGSAGGANIKLSTGLGMGRLETVGLPPSHSYPLSPSSSAFALHRLHVSMESRYTTAQ